jgi:hypothetical protein
MSLPNLSATGVFNISYLIAIDGNHTFKNPNT